MYNQCITKGDIIVTEVTVKRWGNSVGVILPKEMVERNHLKVNDTVMIEIVKRANLRKVFGSGKRKMSGQKFKDLVRQGWQ